MGRKRASKLTLKHILLFYLVGPGLEDFRWRVVIQTLARRGIQAIAHGTPVLATDTEGICQQIGESKAG